MTFTVLRSSSTTSIPTTPTTTASTSQRASSFTAVQPSRPSLAPRRHTMRPLRSSPLAGPALALRADGVAVLRNVDDTDEGGNDADISTLACGSASSSSEHGKATASAPASLRAKGHGVDEHGRLGDRAKKLKKRVSVGFGLSKLKSMSFLNETAAAQTHGTSSAAEKEKDKARAGSPSPTSESAVSHWSSSTGGLVRLPEQTRTRRRSALLPPLHSGTSVSVSAHPRHRSYLGPSPTHASASRSQSGHSGEHWLTAVPGPRDNRPLTEIVKAMADPASPEATWLQVVAPPKFSREGLASQGVVMPVRKTEAGAGMGRRSRSAMAVVGGSQQRAGAQGQGQARARVMSASVGMSAKGKERETPWQGEIVEVARDRKDVSTSPRPIPARADSGPSAGSQTSANGYTWRVTSSGSSPALAGPGSSGSHSSLIVSPQLVRSESPLAALGKRVSAEFAKTHTQIHTSNNDPATLLVPPSQPFASAPTLSRASSDSSLASAASFETAAEIPLSLSAPAPAFLGSEHAPMSEESLASMVSSPPEIGSPGVGTSLETPSLTRSRTASTSVSASVRFPGEQEKGSSMVEVQVNGLPVELVPLPTLPAEAKLASKGRGTLKKKTKTQVVHVELGSEKTEPEVKRSNTIKRVWKRVVKSVGGR